MQEEAAHVMTMSRVPAPVNVRVVMQVRCMAMEMCVLVGCKVLVYTEAIARRHRRIRGALGVQ